MRQLIISLLLAVCTVCSAQTNHMKFKGIPIEGTLDSFVQKLKSKGFTYLGQQDGMALLKGEFAATKGCTIGVARFSDRDQVNLVAVIFPEEESWSGITKSYYTLKDMLTEAIRSEMKAVGCQIDSEFRLHVTLGRINDIDLTLPNLQDLVSSVSLKPFTLKLTCVDYRVFRGQVIYETKLSNNKTN